ncbi:transketolase [uncultured Rikenella sp.]|uniref:transketolase n=1 Tax=uncultured Rikenella sp. TaxID=368003 RepID=UPI0026366016|nr:transketolase [uncultured Rikenella sp.]
MAEIKQLETVAAQARRDIVRMVASAASGHPGGSLGAADVLAALYFDVMDIPQERIAHFDPAGNHGDGEDLFYLSNGHLSPLFYSILARRGYFPVAELGEFRRIGARVQGHPTPAKELPGVRVASGSLGQGLSVAVGNALAKKLSGDDAHRVFVMMGDGELEEGQIWEAAMFAAARGVDNVIGIVDMNGQQIDGSCAAVLGMGCARQLRAKWEAFGWTVIDMDGHDMQNIVDTLHYARNEASGHGKPVVILARTIMGRGVDFMAGTNEWHGKAPNAEQAEVALAQLPTTELGDY